MKIDLHILQNFAPSNLNRDDTGAPKDCEFGGVRRARISSQCLKRSIRQAFEVHQLFGDETTDVLAARTKRLVGEVADLLSARGHDRAEAFRLVAFALQGAKLSMKKDTEKTQYLLFIPRRLVNKLADVVHTHWDVLLPAASTAVDEAEPQTDKKKPKSKANEKASAKAAVPKEVTAAVISLFKDTSATPDLALFGRMIADNADWNVDAACQVAHALSTHRVTMEFDFYTAVDDLKSEEETGSDMMGSIPFQSACFYRYACLDVNALSKNLGTNTEETAALTPKTLEAFLKAAALAIPTGKQNSMAAQNLPSYMVAVVRSEGAPQSLANAFVKPVRASSERSIIEASADALEKQLQTGLNLWGNKGVTVVRCGEVSVEGQAVVPSFAQWVADVVAAGRLA